MPRKLQCSGPGKLEWVEYKEPALKAGEIRIKSEFSAAKHGTEMASYKGYGAHRGSFDAALRIFRREPGASGGYPAMTGNMVVGRVTEVAGDVSDFAVGERALTYGSFSETHVVPNDFRWKVPESVDWRSAVCLDPADFALGAVRDGHVRIGDVVAVFGMGAIGLVVVQIAKAAGASIVIAVDPLPIRRAASSKCGADVALDPAACDAGLEIKKASGGRGADVVIEFSGAVPALQAALRGVAYGGNVVFGAYPPAYGAGLDLGAESHVNTPNIIFSRACSEPLRDHPRWCNRRIYEACWKLILDGKINGEHVVTPVVPFGSLLTEYPKIATEPGSNIKLGVKH